MRDSVVHDEPSGCRQNLGRLRGFWACGLCTGAPRFVLSAAPRSGYTGTVNEERRAIPPVETVHAEHPRPVLDEIDAPLESSQVTLTSGRRYELETAGEKDRLTIRARGGAVILRIEVTDDGPILSFTSAAVELTSTRRLHLCADEIELETKRDLRLAVGGALTETVGGDHHLRVNGAERVEASAIELQANTKSVAVRAMGKIALDGEHIGLNDDPAPQPFPWSEIADGPEEQSE